MRQSQTAPGGKFDFAAAVNSTETPEIRPLTGIRGLAAWLVVCLHFAGVWYILMPSVEPITHLRGYLGVDLFFILSGFILSYVHRADSDRFGWGEYRRFLWLRFARIYPNHLAMLLCLIGLVLAGKFIHADLSGQYRWSELPFQLTMTHRFPYLPGGQWNFPSWSISAEWFAYMAIFPVCWHLLKRDWSTTASLVLAYVLLGIWLAVQCHANDAGTKPGTWWAVIHVSCEFAAGALLFQACRKGGALIDFLRRQGTWVFLLMVGLFFLPSDAPLVLIFPLVLASFTSEDSWISKVFSTGPALWMGKISYALYMSHGVMLKCLKIALPPEKFAQSSAAVRAGLLLGEILLLLAFAAALCYLVEFPARNFLRRLGRKRSAN
jgi:peptidoglycan/LPS O-acetylase OafA/YrhL